jgi:bidirectional [NiFe] hydrogenase diaphorase subunit
MTAVPTLTVDGRPVSARPGQTLLEVCREHGVALPTLCHLDGLADVGACRLCLVEVQGAPRLQPACTTVALEGMEVLTDTDRLRRHRRAIVELLLAEGNHACAVCTARGACELQALAESLGVTAVRFPYRHPRTALDASHPRFVLDPGRCVLCTRCVRVCDEIEGAHTWDVAGRGAGAHVVTDLAAPWGRATSCTGCGKCVQACPTGALLEQGAVQGAVRKDRGLVAALRRAREERRWTR